MCEDLFNKLICKLKVYYNNLINKDHKKDDDVELGIVNNELEGIDEVFDEEFIVLDFIEDKID